MSHSPQKVALLLHDLEKGGMQAVCLKLVKALSEHPDLEIELVLSNQMGGFLNQLPSNLKTINLGIPFQLCLKYSYKLTVALSRYLRQSKPDIILSNLPFVNVITLLAQGVSFSKVRTILIEHTLPLERSLEQESESSLGRRFTGVVTKMTQLLYPHAACIVTPSHGMAKEIAQAIGLKIYHNHKLEVIYNPVVDDQLHQKAKAPLEHPWFLENQPPVFLAVGRLTPQKDYATLLHGFALLRQQMPARLIILGDGPMRSHLESLVETLDIKADVLLPGFVDNPYAYMSRASAFVLSSVWETFGVVLVEALACGCPVISTDCDYGPTEILENGKYGILVPVRDCQALAEAMEVTLAQLNYDRENLRTRAHTFSLEQAVNQYLKIMGITESISALAKQEPSKTLTT
ncbi:MAG: glycosyltransferase [Leptolyngbyaceae cyanobacterium]